MMEKGGEHRSLVIVGRVDLGHDPAAVDEIGAVCKAQNLVDLA